MVLLPDSGRRHHCLRPLLWYNVPMKKTSGNTTYKFKFDLPGLIIFLIIMIPNFIWFGVKAPHDVLRAESVTKTVDIIGSVCQLLMIICLILIVNQTREKLRPTTLLKVAGAAVVLYYIWWVIYYTGSTHPVVLLGLAIFPCVAFLLYAIDRKNLPAVVFTAGFAICHVIYTIVNFIV